MEDVVRGGLWREECLLDKRVGDPRWGPSTLSVPPASFLRQAWRLCDVHGRRPAAPAPVHLGSALSALTAGGPLVRLRPAGLIRGRNRGGKVKEPPRLINSGPFWISTHQQPDEGTRLLTTVFSLEGFFFTEVVFYLSPSRNHLIVIE